MHILRIIPTLDPRYGGPVSGLLATSHALSRKGVSTEVITLDNPDAPWLRSLPLAAFGLGPGMLKPGFTRRLNDWIDEHAGRFDAAIIHGIWTHASVGGAAALRRAGVPYLLYTHGMMDPWFRRAKPIKHWVKQAFWLAQGRALAGAEAVLFTAEQECHLARNQFWGPSYVERVVSYGAARPVQDAHSHAVFRSCVPELEDRPFILYLGRIHAKKGCDLLVQAHRLSPQSPDLVLAGPDPQGRVRRLLASADNARVHYAGALYDGVKAAALKEAEALALISHQENFGVVLAEAMALGTPVLTTNKVNIWPTIERTRAGLIAEDTVEGACELLRSFCALGGPEKVRMSRAALACYDANFSIEKAADDLLMLLEETQKGQQWVA